MHKPILYKFSCGCEFDLTEDELAISRKKKIAILCPIHKTSLTERTFSCIQCGQAIHLRLRGGYKTLCDACKKKPAKIKPKIIQKQTSKLKRNPACSKYNDCLSAAAIKNKTFSCLDCKDFDPKSFKEILEAEDSLSSAGISYSNTDSIKTSLDVLK